MRSYPKAVQGGGLQTGFVPSKSRQRSNADGYALKNVLGLCLSGFVLYCGFIIPESLSHKRDLYTLSQNFKPTLYSLRKMMYNNKKY